MTPEEEKDEIANRRVQRLIGFAAAALIAAAAVSIMNGTDVPQRLKELMDTKVDVQNSQPADSTIILTKTPD